MSTSRIAAEAVQGILRVTGRAVGIHSRQLDRREPERILVICLSHLGDLVLLTPPFANLRLEYPRAHITIVCKSAVGDIPRNRPAVDEVITYEARWTLRPESRRTGLLHTVKLIRELQPRR